MLNRNTSYFFYKTRDGSLFYTLKILLTVNPVNLDNCFNEIPSSSFSIFLMVGIKNIYEFFIIFIICKDVLLINASYHDVIDFTFTYSYCFPSINIIPIKVALSTVLGDCQTKNCPSLFWFNDLKFKSALTWNVKKM